MTSVRSSPYAPPFSSVISPSPPFGIAMRVPNGAIDNATRSLYRLPLLDLFSKPLDEIEDEKGHMSGKYEVVRRFAHFLIHVLFNGRPASLSFGDRLHEIVKDQIVDSSCSESLGTDKIISAVALHQFRYIPKSSTRAEEQKLSPIGAL